MLCFFLKTHNQIEVLYGFDNFRALKVIDIGPIPDSDTYKTNFIILAISTWPSLSYLVYKMRTIITALVSSSIFLMTLCSCRLHRDAKILIAQTGSLMN